MVHGLPLEFVCSQRIGLADGVAQAEQEGRDDLIVVVASCDSIYTMKAWADTHSYRSPLLSDFWPHGDVARDYGVFNPREGLATRGTFLIDADGVVRWSVVNPKGQARDIEDYRREVSTLLGG